MNNFRHAVDVGLSFGLTSGVITTTGLMVGVYSGTASTAAVLSSIVTIAVADALSDALGIHIAEESENVHSPQEIWVATLITFVAKFCIAASFAIPVLIWPLRTAVMINIGYGIAIQTIYNYIIGKRQKGKVAYVIAEHLLIALAVVVSAHYLGQWIGKKF
jgi:VIT1/CCC1 family predicted Fe2+/Mn2+ transporter